jgi:hypothetical protein
MRLGIAALIVFLSAFFQPLVPVASGAIFTFDSPGDVTTSPTQAAGTWYTDRYAPSAFGSGFDAPDNRPGTLLEVISAADSAGHRPAGFNDPFYNTQGRKFDVEAGTRSVSIELYVPKNWDDLNQSQNLGRLASVWGTGFDSSNAVSAFPIIEFNNNADGSSLNSFRVWNGSTWEIVSGFTGFDQWYTLGMVIDGLNEYFYINGNLVDTISDSTTTQIGNVILQGYNSAHSYDIYWDNLQTSTAAQPIDPIDPVSAPEPATLAIFSIGGAALASFHLARRRKSAAGRP